jgi:hypothetical protein
MKKLILTIMSLSLVCSVASAKGKKQSSRSALEQEFGKQATKQARKAAAPATSHNKTSKELKKMERELLRTVNPQTLPNAPRPQAASSTVRMLKPAPLSAKVSGSAKSDRRRKVTAPYATVRANRKGYFIGTLFRKNPATARADQFKLRDVRGGWAAGNVRGFGKLPVWVQLNRLGKTPLAPYHGRRTPVLTGDASRRLLLKNYAAVINRPPKGVADGSRATLKRPARLYLNMDFQHGKPLNPHPVTLRPDPNRRLQWRWMTDDRRYLAVRTFRVNDDNKRITPSRWGFVRCTSVSATLGGKPLGCR